MGGARLWTELLVGIRFKAGNGDLCGAVPTALAALAAGAALAAALAALAAASRAAAALAPLAPLAPLAAAERPLLRVGRPQLCAVRRAVLLL